MKGAPLVRGTLVCKRTDNKMRARHGRNPTKSANTALNKGRRSRDTIPARLPMTAPSNVEKYTLALEDSIEGGGGAERSYRNAQVNLALSLSVVGTQSTFQREQGAN